MQNKKKLKLFNDLKNYYCLYYKRKDVMNIKIIRKEKIYAQLLKQSSKVTVSYKI